jgi:cell division protein FtsN
MNKLQQRGSTLLGIIIGLIIGLAIAVVVALVITKGASPFVNKVSRVEKTADSASASASINDPNKPLYSSTDAAKEAAKEFKTKPDFAASTPDAADPLNKAENKTDSKAETKPESKATEDKLDKLIDKALAGKLGDGKADGHEDKWTYYLQAGAFRELSDAENTRAKLALLGFEASLVERKTESGVLYRVHIGPFEQTDAMNRVRSKLMENGVDVAVVRNQK